MRIALDATYSVGKQLTGVGVYSREILHGLAKSHPEAQLLYCYRPHRFLKSFDDPVPPAARRRLLTERGPLALPTALFHGLNQRMPQARQRRSVSTFHDLFVMTSEYSTAEFRQRFTQQARHAAERSDLIICVSAFTASQVASLLDVEPSRLRVIHHGVYAPSALPPMAGREPIVLTVGSIQKRKNSARLVEAFARTRPGWKLILAGATGYGAEETIEAVQRSGRAADIEITGYVSQQSLEDLYRRASLFAFPSLDEGFGIPVVEAMAWGLPVLTSNRPALLEVSGHAAIHVDPRDTDAMQHQMQTLMDDAALRQSLAARGRSWAAGFTWEKAVNDTWSVYKELLP